jgi:hypothetical protein
MSVDNIRRDATSLDALRRRFLTLTLIVVVSFAVRVAAFRFWGTGAIESDGAEYASIRYEPSAIVRHPVPQERITKQYFFGWWFDFGRALVREWVAGLTS